METVDYTGTFSDAASIRAAHGRGKNFLFLERLPRRVRRFDGVLARWGLEYRWLSCPCRNSGDEAYVCALGVDRTYWTEKEIEDALEGLEKGDNLFDHFNLF